MKLIPCAICGSTDTKKLFAARDMHMHIDDVEYALVKCTVCSLVYINPQPSPEELEKYYPKDYPPYLPNFEVFSRSRTNEFFKKIRNRIKPQSLQTVSEKKKNTAPDMSEKTVLDFGCGNGGFLRQLKDEHPHWKLFGFDIAANKTVDMGDGSITIYHDATENIEHDFAAGFFDTIYLNNVLEHVNDPKETLTRLSRLLKADGEMIIEVPNIDSVKFKIFRKNFASLDIPRHLYHFSPATLEKLCTACGLKIRKTEFSGTTKSTMRSIHFMFGVRKHQFNPLLYKAVDIATKKIPNFHNDSLRIFVSKN